MSKLKASTRKLASKLGIGHHKKDRGRGVDTPTGGGSPRAESPMPASPAAAAIPAAGAGTTPAAVPLSPHSPVAPVTPGLEGPLQTGLEAPLQAASPLLVAGGGTESPRRQEGQNAVPAGAMSAAHGSLVSRSSSPGWTVLGREGRALCRYDLGLGP